MTSSRTIMACSQGLRNPASRLRIVQYIPYLEQRGWKVSYRPNRPGRPSGMPAAAILSPAILAWRRLSRLHDILDAPQFDVIFQNRDLLEGRVRWEQMMYRRNPRVVFDFDDAIFLGPKKEEHIRWICRNAAWVTAGSEYLADFARQATEKVTVLPTVVDTDRYVVKDYTSAGAPVRVGWCGSNLSIRQTLFPFLPMLAGLQQRLNFDLVIISKPRPSVPELDLKWSYVEWSEAGEGRLAEQIDIGIMPLVDDEFQKGKCGAKLVQYMAAGLPAVASPVGASAQIVQPGVTGWLAATEEEWQYALENLMWNSATRETMGTAARARCEEKYSVKAWLPALLEILERVAAV